MHDAVGATDDGEGMLAALRHVLEERCGQFREGGIQVRDDGDYLFWKFGDQAREKRGRALGSVVFVDFREDAFRDFVNGQENAVYNAYHGTIERNLLTRNFKAEEALQKIDVAQGLAHTGSANLADAVAP